MPVSSGREILIQPSGDSRESLEGDACPDSLSFNCKVLVGKVERPPNGTTHVTMTTDRNGALRYALLPFIARLLLVAEFVVAVNGKITVVGAGGLYAFARHARHHPPARHRVGNRAPRIDLPRGRHSNADCRRDHVRVPRHRERDAARLLEHDRQRRGRQRHRVLQEPRNDWGACSCSPSTEADAGPFNASEDTRTRRDPWVHGTTARAPARSACSRATPAAASLMYPFATCTIAGVGGTSAISI